MSLLCPPSQLTSFTFTQTPHTHTHTHTHTHANTHTQTYGAFGSGAVVSEISEQLRGIVHQQQGELPGNKDTRVAEGERGRGQASGTRAKNVDLKK